MANEDKSATLVPPGEWLEDQDRPAAGSLGIGFRFLLGATLLGAFLRLYGLTFQSLWVDEMLTWQSIRPGADLHFLEQILDSIQGPLYMAIVWPLVRLQDPALMMRLPSAIAGILSVAAFGWLLGMWWDRRPARLATLMFAMNPFLIWYAQEGRGYSLLVFFLVVQALVFTKMIQGKLTIGKALAFAFFSAGAMLSNLSGLFLFLAMGLSVLVFFRPHSGKEWGIWTIAFGLGILLVAPWLLKASGIWAIDRAVPGAVTGVVLRGETTFTWMALPYSFFSFFFGSSFGPSLRELHQPDRIALVKSYLPILAAGAIPVGLGLASGVLRLPRRHLFLWLWILVPMIILVFLAVRNIKPWNPRYVMVVLPWLLAVVALGLSRLPGRTGLIVALCWSGLTLWSLGNYYWHGKYAKADVQMAVEQVAERNTQQAPILVPAVTPVYKYYHEGEAEILGTFEWEPLASAEAADRFLAERLGGIEECWVVLAREWHFDPKGLLLPALAGSGRLTLIEKLPGVRVYHWSRTASGK